MLQGSRPILPVFERRTFIEDAKWRYSGLGVGKRCSDSLQSYRDISGRKRHSSGNKTEI
jgi:hypothetical protein